MTNETGCLVLCFSKNQDVISPTKIEKLSEEQLTKDTKDITSTNEVIKKVEEIVEEIVEENIDNEMIIQPYLKTIVESPFEYVEEPVTIILDEEDKEKNILKEQTLNVLIEIIKSIHQIKKIE